MRQSLSARVVAALVIGLAFWSPHGSFVFAAEVGPDQGLVIFHRASSMKGKAIRFNIEQNGVPIGQLLSGSTLEVPLAPGSYSFTVRAPSVDGMDYLTLNVEAGVTYQVEGEILWGWPAGRPKFSNVSQSGAPTQPASAPTADRQPTQVAATAPAAAASRPSVSAEEAGRLGLRNFAGDWNVRMWSLASNGNELEGRGTAQGTLEGDNAVQIEFTTFEAPDFPDAIGGGRVLIAHEAGRGFSLETHLGYTDEVLRLTGGYMADSNRYVFYLVGGPGGDTATGIERTSVRLEIRTLDTRSWVAETFAHVDGQSTQVQSTRFAR